MRRGLLAGAWLVLAALVLFPPAADGRGEPVADQALSEPRFTDGARPYLDRPFPADARKFHFAVIGDKTGGGEENWPVFDRAMGEVNRLRPDFAIMVGDMIQGYTDDSDEVRRQWDEFDEHAGRLDVPLMLVPGNHDIWGPRSYREWKRRLGPTYYSFDYRGCHFLVLNSEEDARLDGTTFGLGANQVRWALRDLADMPPSRHVFVFLHKPLFLMKGRMRDQWDEIEAALAAKPYIVFAGHHHNLTRYVRDDRRYFVVGPTGGSLRPKPEKVLGAFHHYTIVTVEGDRAHVALVEPGSVHVEDIADLEKKEAYRRRGKAAGVSHRVIQGSLGEVRVGSITDGAAEAAAKALQDLTGKGVGGIVVDLRDAGGTDGDSAASLADLLVPKGKTLWTLVPTEGGIRHVRSNKDAAVDVRVAVLVGENASGTAELVSAAVKAHRAAILVAGHA